MTKYDDASWHSGGDFPEHSPSELSGTHIALFLRWSFVQGWAGPMHLDRWPEDVRGVVEGRLSGTEFLFKNCDGKLSDEDLSEEGNRFAARYYGDEGLYLNDYAEHFGELMYVAPESDHDFSALDAVIAARRETDLLTHSDLKQKKPWWKLW